MSAVLTRSELEDFLFLEAALLDNWQLDEWLALFVEGARYFVPPAGADDDADPSTTLFYVADDYHRLCERVKRLKKTYRPRGVSPLALPTHSEQRAFVRG